MSKPGIHTFHFVSFSFLILGLISCSGNGNKNQTVIDTVKTASEPHLVNFTTVHILDKNIRSIYQDKSGNYWFGTNGAGVFRFDSKKLIQFTTKDGLADNQVIKIQEDEAGNVWFGSGTFGISKFDGAKIIKISENDNITNSTKSEWELEVGDMWFYAGGGAFRYSNSQLNYLPFGTQGSNTAFNKPFELGRFAVYSMLKDRKGNLWFGTQAEGVCKFDGKTQRWFTEKGLAGSAVLGLFEDSKGNLWFGNNGAGLFKFDGVNLINITQKMGLGNPDFKVNAKAGLHTLARVYAINEDMQGNMWIGTVDAGVWKYDGKNLGQFTTQNGLSSNAVNTIFKDRDGVLWFGTDKDGVCKFDGTKFTKFLLE